MAATRDPWFDNAKMALVVLVVLGHSWTLLPSDGVAEHPYDFLYAWHVPAFVLVTGYLSRGFTYSRGRMWRLVRTVAVPYLLFEGAMALFRIHVGGENLEDLWRDPHWPMWFLAALFFWRLMTPVFRALPLAVPIAVALSVGAGLWAGDTLDFARIFGLLPFFVLGLKATPEHLELLRGRGAKVLAVAVLVAIWFLALQTDRWASTEWLYYRAQYSEFPVSDTRAAVTRLVILAVGALGALAFLALVPRVSGWFTRMGAWTIVVYLCHGFFVKAAEYADAGTWLGEHSWAGLLLLSAGAVGVALTLATQPVATRLQHLVDPLGLAERRVTEAVELAAVSQEPERVPEPVG